MYRISDKNFAKSLVYELTFSTSSAFFPPKYRAKVLEGEVAEAAEEIIRENYKALDIAVITNFLKGNIKNKKIEKLLYIPMTYL